ncbi:MAG: twin-arginine translocation signal domain-containing protein, partial [Verrucomicrobiales bacterium]
MQNLPYPDRRTFLKAGAAAAAGALANIRPALAAPGDAPRLRLGIDNFAVRAMGWKAKALIDYAAELECDTLFITDLDAFESLEDAALKEIKAHADDKGIGLLLGTWSICPSSPSFRDNRGTADEHLALGVRAAKALGSPALRVILGSRKDRTTEGGIEARIGDTVAVLKR